MNLASLAFAYARRRPLATFLNVLLLAVGVATITLVILVSSELEGRMQREAAGIDLVVGAKGSPLQIVLAGVYHADVPPGNIPLAAVEELARDPRVREVIPMAMGDSFRGFRIVGTVPAFVAHYAARLHAGGLWAAPLEAVLGSETAQGTGLAVGSSFAGSHGLAEGGGEHGDRAYRVVGVLAPTGTVVDRLVLTGMDSVWAVHDAHGHGEPHDEDADAAPPAREVTLALVKYRSPVAAASLPRAINSRTVLQAAAPAYESARLFSVFGVGTEVVRGFALLLVAASGLGLFVALTQALDERRMDLAIMRTLGASRGRIVGVLLLESAGLVALALVCGLALAHGVAATLGDWLPAAAPLAAGAARWRAEEGWVVLLALAVGIIAAALPAWRAYRLDVAATLAES
ncbi:MAG: ABC transporter permease [Betaproteobacteria bacterium]|nr:ABC transporter permease [Betaproteobacteria bacterium]